MPSTPDVDYLIAGAGCAGLSLAVHLLERGPTERRVWLFDPRTEFGRDRTWCMWRTTPHPFEGCVVHRWRRWTVVAPGGRRITCRTAAHPYEHIPAQAFYDEALRRIERSGRISLHRGATVHSLDERGDHVVADTSMGTVTARLAFDGRPPPPAPEPNDGRPVRWLQHFAGWEVVTDEPRFDPTTPVLMDFDVPQQGAIHFAYVLPFDPRRALVEDTWFSPSPWPPEVYESHLRQYLHRWLGDAGFRIVAREQGRLPMHTDPPRPRASRRIHRIGLAAGVAKPSTGYAFAFIQRHSAALAAGLRRAEPPPVPVIRTRRALALDHIFLSWLRRHPERGPDAFTELFSKAPADAVARFLSETATVADHVRVMAALPPGPLMREALRAAVPKRSARFPAANRPSARRARR